MTSRYVSPSGNDAYDGSTIEEAWRTINHSVNHVSPGDTIFVVPGNYGAEHVLAAVSGTASNPIKITRYNNSGLITLKNDVGNTGRGLEISASHWIVEYFDISDYHFNVFVRHDYNELNSVITSGHSLGGFIVFYTGDYNVFNECIAHHLDVDTGEKKGTGFTIWGNYNYLKNCKAYNNRHFGVAIPGLDENKAVGNIVDGGEFYNMNYDTAVACANAADTVFKNLLVHDCFHGLRCYDFKSINTTIENCTLHNIQYEAILPLGTSTKVINNTVYDSYIGIGDWVDQGKGDVLCYGNDIRNSSVADFRFNNDCPNVIIRDHKNSSFSIRRRLTTCPLTIEFTDNKVFKENSGAFSSLYYPDRSKTTFTSGTSGTNTITVYNMTAIPASGSVTVTVNKFDTSLPLGEILVDFTADTIDGNEVLFVVGDLKPNYDYLIKRNGVNFAIKQTDASGFIRFSNSEWSARTFTIEEPTGTITGIVINRDTGLRISGVTITANGYSTITE